MTTNRNSRQTTTTRRGSVRRHVEPLVTAEEARAIAAVPTQLDAALVASHAEAHRLIAELTVKVDSIDPETANWGHVGDLGWIIRKLRDALGEE